MDSDSYLKINGDRYAMDKEQAFILMGLIEAIVTSGDTRTLSFDDTHAVLITPTTQVVAVTPGLSRRNVEALFKRYLPAEDAVGND